MTNDKIDVGKTLRFGTLRRDVILLAIFAVFGPIGAWLGHTMIVVLCAGFGLFLLYKVVTAPTALTLSPKGIAYAYDGVRFSIPWREISAVEQVNIPSKQGGEYPGATVMTVSRAFYDAKIHTPFGKLLNPSREEYFEIGNDVVRIALYGAFINLQPNDVFAMVDERWKAFRGRAPVSAPQMSSP